MGVPGLSSWLKRRYPEAFVQLPAETAFDYVHIDLSSTLHQIIRRARTKSYFHYLLHRRLDEVLAMARPRQRVVLALDGPAPLAKLLEQRRRRRREGEKAQRAAAAAQQEEQQQDGQPGQQQQEGQQQGGGQHWSSTVDALALQGGFRPPNPELSTLALTTGSRLMLEVHSSLAAYICKKLADPATAHLSFELSDSTVKGEGELKILSRLLHPDSGDVAPDSATEQQEGEAAGSAGQQRQQGRGQRRRRREEETHLVLGADSDLLLMALVAGQPGVFIMSDALDGDPGSKQQRKKHHHKRSQERVEAVAAGLEGRLAGLEATAGEEGEGSESEGESSGGSGTESESESESEGEEASDSEAEEGEAAAAAAGTVVPGVRVGGGQLSALAAATAALAAGNEAAASAAEAAAKEPPVLVFSRDAAERAWRRQHLVPDASAGQAEVTSLALDLMLLAVMSSGNDYLPAIQGLQLSNKRRPGLWDLYCSMRREQRWQGQCLVQRTCACGGGSGGAGGSFLGGADCPSVAINLPMLTALLSEYYSQRFVFWESPQAAAAAAVAAAAPAPALAGAAVGGDSSTSSLSSVGSLSMDSSMGSLSSMDEALVWGQDALAAAAAVARGTQGGAGGSAAPAGTNGKSKGLATAQKGMDPQPESYLEGLEWVLQMYCSGAVRDYRFTYDLAAPALVELLRHLQQGGGVGGAGSSSSRSAASSNGASNGATSNGAGSNGNGAVVGEAEEGADAPAAAAVAALRRPWRSTQPLVPAACAMALLPRGGRLHAATALQHLMDEGSALDDIYSTCDTCSHMGAQQGTLFREVEAARAELAATQLLLGEVANEALGGRKGAARALELLEGEVQQAESELARLKLLMSDLSRSQQEHLQEAHPYKPFPTEALEAAVAAVPLEAYPRHERKLAQFGREFVFRASRTNPKHIGPLEEAVAAGPAGRPWWQQEQGGGPAAEQEAAARQELAAAAAAGEGERPAGAAGEPALPPLQRPNPPGPRVRGEQAGNAYGLTVRRRPLVPSWMKECLSFAAAYPRVADPLSLQRSGLRVERATLPLRPYMQPLLERGADSSAGASARAAGGGSGARSHPSAIMSHCQLLRWGHPGPQRSGSSRQLGARQHGQAGSYQHRRGLAGSAVYCAANPAQLHGSSSQRAGQLAAVPGRAGLQQAAGQRLLHTASQQGTGNAGRHSGRLAADAGVRATLLQGCTRLLGNLRLLRPF